MKLLNHSSFIKMIKNYAMLLSRIISSFFSIIFVHLEISKKPSNNFCATFEKEALLAF